MSTQPDYFKGLAETIKQNREEFILLWEVQGQKWTPKVTFKPEYPGERFTHKFRPIRVGPPWGIACPCGTDFNVTEREDEVTIQICPKCLSWHAITWLRHPDTRPKGVIFC